MADNILPKNPTLDDIKKFIRELETTETDVNVQNETLYLISVTTKTQ